MNIRKTIHPGWFINVQTQVLSKKKELYIKADFEAHLQQHNDNIKANMQEAIQYLNKLADEISASDTIKAK